VARPYYGWFVVAAAMLIYALVIGGTFSAYGLFVLPVSAEFGLSRADTNSGLILLNLGNAVLAPFVGRLFDRAPLKRVMILAALLMGASLMALGLTRSPLLGAAVIAAPLAAATLGVGGLPVTMLVARWFHHRRARAMTLALIGLSLGSVAVTPAIGWLIGAFGWRTALLAIGAVVPVLVVAIVAALRVQPGPQDVERPQDGPGPREAGPAAEPPEPAPAALALLRAPQFWTISLGAALGLAATQAFMVTIVPLGRESGLSMLQAAGLLSVAGAAALAGKLLLAVVADRVDRAALLSGLLSLGVAANATLLLGRDHVTLLVAAALTGATSGAVPPIQYALVADRFGLAAFGTVRGLMIPAVAMAGAVAVRFVGEVFDRTGGYDVAFATFVVTGAMAVVLLLTTWLAKPLREPVRA
jgi:predicted MFS family arabinose efflux permease